ncbi:CLUMA_CG017999, isoform A, partial [Clunio marinus]
FSGTRADDSEALKEAAIVQPTAIVNPFVTQNVYGFADFTTTIGNTVMIFSPSSIPAVPEPVKEETTTKAAIETKPITDAPKQEVIDIQPTKPVSEQTSEQKAPVVSSSAIEVISQEPIPTPATKKPKKKKNKTPSTPNPMPLTVQAITAITPEPPKVVLSSKVEVVEDKKENKFIVEPEKTIESEPVVSSIVEVSDNDEESEVVLQEGNAIIEPEYDFLSRQPTEFVEETYRVVNLKPSVLKKPKIVSKTSARNNDQNHPTGLVTKSGGTIVNGGLTTVHETSVIGTYISGKYAQVLQSTSQIFPGNAKAKIQPSSTLRILKTAAPSFNKTPKYTSNEDDYQAESYSSHPRTTKRPAANGYKNRYRNREEPTEEVTSAPSAPVNPYTSGKKSISGRRNGSGKNKNLRQQNRAQEVATVSAEPAGSYSSRRNKSTRPGFKPSTVNAQQVIATSEPNFSRRTYKQKISPSNVEQQEQQSTSLYKFKLNRTPGRWQYKTTPKPRVTIRKHGSSTNEIAKESLEQLAATPPTDANGNDILQSRVDLDVDLDGSGSVNGDVLDDEATGAGDNKLERKLPIETIKVEISTPADFSDTYYEIATIKSPYTFQVGANKNTRYITVTSTFEKTLDPEPTSTAILTEPLTENILATTSHLDKEHNLLDSSIATLPPISLGEDQATPPLETLTETFSTTQVMLKTHILPVIRAAGNTTSYPLIQTYHVTRLVTATKTLPPMEVYHFVPSRTLNEFNTKLDEAGSELHLELEFGDENEHDEEDEPRRVALPDDLNLENIGSDFDISEVDRSKIPNTTRRPKPKPTTEKPKEANPLGLTPDQLALLRLLNPGAIPNVITTSKPVVKVETVYESHVLPIVNGASTIFSTISRPIATVTKTNYEIGTSILAPVTPPPINPLLLQQQPQQQFQIQSTPVVQQQIVTQTDSKVLKLTFGARTAYTTLYNTRVVPTMVTSYLTQSIPLQPSAFPGYFPAPYPQFPFVG